MEKVAVLISTYNGEKYIRDQINSILNQNDVDIYIFIRDDGSLDNTPEILSEYEKKYSNIYFINSNDRKNIGIKNSYLVLLKYALQFNVYIPFYAFSDQDDVWLPEKIEDAVKMLNLAEDDKPALYFSNKIFVDESLNILFEEKQNFRDDFFALFYNSGASGCTMVFNRYLAELSIRFVPQYTDLHDQWIFRIAHCVGAEFCFGNQSYILYRQHGNNVCGMEACMHDKHNWRNFAKKKTHKLQKGLNEILYHYTDELSQKGKTYLKLVENYNTCFKSKIRLAIAPEARYRGLKKYFFWIITLLRETI